MRNYTVIVPGSILCILLFATLLCAQIAQPGLINYQGKLANDEGKLVTDTLSFTFSINDAATGGTPLWTETHPAVFVWGGVYNVLLGSVVPIPEAIFWDPVPGTAVVRMAGDRWLEVQINPGCTIEPRQRLAAVAYAIHADVLDGRHATEFVSSVHPDTMDGLEWCSDDTTTLTVTNECAGGGIRGESPTGIGVKGLGTTGVIGLATQAGDTALYGRAVNPAVLAGYFNGNLLVNGDMQLGMDVVDPYNYLRIPGGNAWGYLFAPGPLDDGAMSLAFNYHRSSAGHVFDNTSVGSATTQIKIGNGTLEFYTSKLTTVPGVVQEPQKRLSVLPSGKTVFAGPLEVRGHAQFCTLTVDNVAQISDGLRIDGSLGIGTPSPTDCRLHVKGSGWYKGNHIALFENTSLYGDAMAIKVQAGTPGSTNKFVSFLNATGDTKGRIEGQTLAEYNAQLSVIFDWIVFGVLEAISLGKVIMALVMTPNCVGQVPPVPCSPVIAQSVAAAAQYIALGVAKSDLTDHITGHIGVVYESGSADYAEWLERMNVEESMAPGDIVGVNGGRISKSTAGAQQIMVVSASPIVVGNMPPEDEEYRYEKVAFKGQVPVRVIGPVKDGEYIIPSGFEDGTGIAVAPELMTADEFSKVLGRAWDHSESHFSKLVTVAVGLNSRDIASIVQKAQNTHHQLDAALNEVEERVANLKELNRKVIQLEADLNRNSETYETDTVPEESGFTETKNHK